MYAGTESRWILHRNKVQEEKSIRSTAIPQNPTSEREPRYVFTPPQPFFVFRSDLKQLFHHYFCERSTTMYTARETYSAQLEDKGCCTVGAERAMRCIMGAECEMHCGCGNGNDDNSDTGGSERKIGARFLQCNRSIYFIYLCISHHAAPFTKLSHFLTTSFNMSSLSMSYNYIAVIRFRALKTRHTNFNSDVSSAHL